MKRSELFFFIRLLFTLGCFSSLMFFDQCPAWFISLLLTVGLLQLSGWVFLKIHDLGPHADGGLPWLSRLNHGAQLAWIACLVVPLAAPNALRIGTFFELCGYLTLAVLQIFDFYLRFCQYRPLLLADLRQLTATP